VVLQVCLDESGKGDPNMLVIAGYVSTTEKWAQFSDEWQELLDYDSLYYRKIDYFKMAEMTSSGDRERCAWFYRVIEKYAMAAVSFTLSTKELKHVIETTFPTREEAGNYANPWYFVAHILMPLFVENIKGMPNLGLPQEPVDFVFDEVVDKKALLSRWDEFKNQFPNQSSMIVGTPSFPPDDKYLPLQAADLLAWWVRYWQLDGFKRREIYQCVFPWPRSMGLPWNHISGGEKEIRYWLEISRGLRPRGVSVFFGDPSSMTPVRFS
jgi:Protein of unknown function (DUF3800)